VLRDGKQYLGKNVDEASAVGDEHDSKQLRQEKSVETAPPKHQLVEGSLSGTKAVVEKVRAFCANGKPQPSLEEGTETALKALADEVVGDIERSSSQPKAHYKYDANVPRDVKLKLVKWKLLLNAMGLGWVSLPRAALHFSYLPNAVEYVGIGASSWAEL